MVLINIAGIFSVHEWGARVLESRLIGGRHVGLQYPSSSGFKIQDGGYSVRSPKIIRLYCRQKDARLDLLEAAFPSGLLSCF